MTQDLGHRTQDIVLSACLPLSLLAPCFNAGLSLFISSTSSSLSISLSLITSFSLLSLSGRFPADHVCVIKGLMAQYNSQPGCLARLSITTPILAIPPSDGQPGYTAWHGKARQPGYPTSFGGLARHGGQPIQLALVARLSGPVTRRLRTQKKTRVF